MRNIAFILLVIGFSPSVYAGNSYIEFGQFEKVQQVSVAAGALYACSTNESVAWPKRHGYQFVHFKLAQVVNDYFKFSYRVIAVQNISLSEKVALVDKHRKVENKIYTLQEGGFNLVQKGEMKCEDAAAFAAEVMKYHD